MFGSVLISAHRNKMFGLVFTSILLSTASAHFLSSPGLQRTYPGDDCLLEWRINRVASSISFGRGSQSNPVDVRRIVQFNATSRIKVTLRNVTLNDAGNYTLTVVFVGDSVSTVDYGACLFVYGMPTTSLILSAGANPTTEGGTMSFTCNGTSTSMPVQYRQSLTYTFQMYSYFVDVGYLTRRSDGSVVGGSGIVFDRYSINNGNVLKINSVSHLDVGFVYCTAADDLLRTESDRIYVSVNNYKPAITRYFPPSLKYNFPGSLTTLAVEFEADPAPSQVTWSFSQSQSGPFVLMTPGSGNLIQMSHYWRAENNFNFTSNSQIGFYRCSISNSLGTTVATFQLMSPGIPEAPVSAQLVVTDLSINVQWNSMWDNGRAQHFMVWLMDAKHNTVVDRMNISENAFYTSGYYSIYYGSPYDHFYNYTYVANFSNNGYPDQGYEVLLWSVNELGSSDVVRLPIPTSTTFIVSVYGTQSAIEFPVNDDMTSRLDVECCELNSFKYVESTYFVDSSNSQQQFRLTIPTGTRYQFVLSLYDSSDQLVAYSKVQIPTPADVCTSQATPGSILQPTPPTLDSHLSTPCPSGDSASYCGGIQAWQCYNYKSICCARCPSYYNASRTGCEYGDTVDWCVSFVQTYKDCQRPEVASQCCLTCPKFPAPTTTTMMTPIFSDLSEPCMTGDMASYCPIIQSYSCYFYNEICCASCPMFYNASNVGCEYGDRVPWCMFYVGSQKECQRPEVAQFCCMTCRKYSNSLSMGGSPQATPCPTGDKAWFCDTLPAYRCYLDHDVCCAACPRFYSAARVGCEYGDQVSWCTAFIRSARDCQDPSNARDCCLTCQQYVARVIYGEVLYLNGSQLSPDLNNRTTSFINLINAAMNRYNTLEQYYENTNVLAYTDDVISKGIICSFTIQMTNGIDSMNDNAEPLIHGAIQIYFDSIKYFGELRCLGMVDDPQSLSDYSC